jgi:hypothetical protein
MTSTPEGPAGAPESTATTYLRVLGFLGLVLGTAVGGMIGGWWWALGVAIFVGTSLIAAVIDITTWELGRNPRHR